jgi:hypothetical protein
MTQSRNTAEAISGRATGVLFFAGFGSLWLYNGLSAMHALNFITATAIVAVLAALVVPAVLLLRSAAGAEGATPESAEMKRAFHRVNAMQWIAILASVVLFSLLQRQEFLVPVITFIVGLHLFPLARLFHYPAHNVTGSLLVLWAIAVVALFDGSAMPSIGAVGTAAILLGSAAWALVRASLAASSLRSPSHLSPAGV